jgi:hypothetical protein
MERIRLPRRERLRDFFEQGLAVLLKPGRQKIQQAFSLSLQWHQAIFCRKKIDPLCKQ